jgi:hypothetical protein
MGGAIVNSKRTIVLELSEDDATELVAAISDILCWIRGFKAGCEDQSKHPIDSHRRLQDLNGKLKLRLQ